MKRALTSFVAISLLLLSNPAQSAAPSAKVGGACSKIGATAKAGSVSLTCVKSGKKLLWTKVSVQPPKPSTTPSSAPTQPAPAPTSNPLPTTVYYTAKDQSTVQLINAFESCSNPKNASFEIQALVGSQWLPVRLLDFGWNVSATNCSNPVLGARTSLGWAKVYMDPGTQYRWIFSGEINMEFRDAQGRGTSQTYTLPGPAPAPSPTQLASPTPKPFKAVIPISLPIVQNKPITFANAVSQYAQIPQVAWQNIQDTIAANPVVDIPTTIVIGPNTDTTLEQITNALKKEYRLWSGFAQPTSYAGLVYNAKDEAWAETEWPKLAAQLNLTKDPSAWIPNHLRAGCNFDNGVATECYGGMALSFASTDTGFAFYGVQSPYWSQSSFQAGPFSQVTHEYLHNVQMAQWNGYTFPSNIMSKSQIGHNTHPCWFSEGQANAIGIPIVSNDVSSYINGRDNSVRRKINQNTTIKPTLTDNGLTAEALASFLYNQDPATCYDPGKNGDYQLGYNIGYAATEVLVAIGGPQSTMALLGETASGMSWADAFQTVYGITWKEGSDILGKVLAAEYSAKPMDH